MEKKEREIIMSYGYSLYDSFSAQVSINSDGCMVLRYYDVSSKNSYDIVIFTPSETRVFIELLSNLIE